MINLIGIIIIILQLICLGLEIYFYIQGEMEKGLNMNLLVVFLVVIWFILKAFN